MTQLDLGMKLKDEGMTAATVGREYNLHRARQLAKSQASHSADSCTTIDAVQNAYTGFDWTSLGNAAGSVFREPCWEHVGYRKSLRPSSHARVISVWRLKA